MQGRLHLWISFVKISDSEFHLCWFEQWHNLLVKGQFVQLDGPQTLVYAGLCAADQDITLHFLLLLDILVAGPY
jgi:hypothetical protein